VIVQGSGGLVRRLRRQQDPHDRDLMTGTS
jgi:hypothetical protein